MVCCGLLLFGLFQVRLLAAEGERIYGPVIDGESLASIAIVLSSGNPWHYQLWMYALYMENPDAFYQRNMNQLRIGSLLQIPTHGDMAELDQRTGFLMVEEHMRSWRLEQGAGEVEEDANSRQDRQAQEDLLLRARLRRLMISNERNMRGSARLSAQLGEIETAIDEVVQQTLRSGLAASGSDVAEGRRGTTEPMVEPPAVLIESGDSIATVGSVRVLPLQQRDAQADPIPPESSAMGWFWWLLVITVGGGVGYHYRQQLRAGLWRLRAHLG